MHDDDEDNRCDIADSSGRSSMVQQNRFGVQEYPVAGGRSTQKQCVTGSNLVSIHGVGRIQSSSSASSSVNLKATGRQPTVSRVDVFSKSPLWSSAASVDNSAEDQQSPIAYPGIPFQVAKFLCESNPEIVERMEAALHNSMAGTRSTAGITLNADAAAPADACENGQLTAGNGNRFASSSLDEMALITDALGLQQSVIGGLAEAPAEVRQVTNDAITPNHDSSKELHRFPRERIVTQFERRSWLLAGRNGGHEVEAVDVGRNAASSSSAAAPATTLVVNGCEFHREPVGDCRSEEGCSESELDSTMSDVGSDVGGGSGNGSGNALVTRERVRLLDALREKASIEGHLEIVAQEAERGRTEVAQLQSRLSTARSQMAAHVALSRAAGQEVESMRRMLDDAARRLHDSEDLCVGLREALDARAGEVAQCKAESADAEAEARQLRIALQEAKVDAESRDSAVAGLKAKVAELHGQLEEATRVRSQTDCELEACRRECASESKMKDWYRNRVESLQEARQAAQREALAATADAAEARSTAQRLRFEGERLGKQLADVQQRAVREKENLVHHLETIEADVREREAAVLQQHVAQSNNGGGLLFDRMKVVEAERARLAEEAYARTQLELQLDAMKSELDGRAESQSRAEREAATLASRVVVLQKTVDDDRLELDAAYERYARLEGKCRELDAALRESHELTSAVRRENVSLEVELSSARNERGDVDLALLEVRTNVTKLDGRMRRLRDELAIKTRAHDTLVQENSRLQDELSIRESALERRRNREARLEREVQELEEEASRLKKAVELHEDKSDTGVNEATANDDAGTNDSQEIGGQSMPNVPLLPSSLPQDEDMDSTVALLTRNLNDALEAKKRLEGDLEATVAKLAAVEQPSSPIEPPNCNNNNNNNVNLNTKAYFYRKRVAALEKKLEAAQKLSDEEKKRADRTQELLIEAEKEKGRLLALSESAEALRQHATSLEASLADREKQVLTLESLVSDSTERGQRDVDVKSQRMEELEKRLGSEQSTNRELRRQVFKEMCDAKDARKNLANTKESFEETVRLLEVAKSRLQAMEAEAKAAEKTVAELRLERTELKNRLRKLECESNDLQKELEECHAKDEMLADQVKSVGWHLNQKSQEIVRLQEEAREAEEHHVVQLEAARQAADGFKREAEAISAELSACSKEKFSYRARLMALNKAAAAAASATAKVAPDESQGRPEDFLIESPAPYDESLVASLLQQSLQSLPTSRPLSHLRLCLDTLKQEMAILQRQLLEHDD